MILWKTDIFDVFDNFIDLRQLRILEKASQV